MYRNETTGPTSLKISMSCSSVASYGMFPTVQKTISKKSKYFEFKISFFR
jgi:hypothetical protein